MRRVVNLTDRSEFRKRGRPYSDGRQRVQNVDEPLVVGFRRRFQPDHRLRTSRPGRSRIHFEVRAKQGQMTSSVMPVLMSYCHLYCMSVSNS